jgi:hypothetical protein
MPRAQLFGRRKGSLVSVSYLVYRREGLVYLVTRLEGSSFLSQHPLKNICVQVTSTRSRNVWRTVLTIDPYPSRCWLRGPVNPIGLCCRVPSPAIREINMLACWSFATGLSV